MSIKTFIHPETVSKNNLLYRGWRHLIQNRFWHGRVPRRQHICLWFWPALFGTFLFTPLLYPLMLVTIYPLKYAVIAIGYGIYYPLKAIYLLLRFLLSRPIGWLADLCRIRLRQRLTAGHVMMLAIGIGMAWIPGVNYWWVGVTTVFLVSLLVIWISLSLISAFFRSIWQLLGALPSLWLKSKESNSKQTAFWLWATLLCLALASPVVLWQSKAVSSIYQFIAILLGIVLGLVGVSAYIRYWGKKHPSPEPAPRMRPTRPKRESWTKPIGIFIRAKENDLCPMVEFVD